MTNSIIYVIINEQLLEIAILSMIDKNIEDNQYINMKWRRTNADKDTIWLPTCF